MSKSAKINGVIPILMNKDFQHLNVVEIASVLAGPSVGLFFAEMGASVVKIENKASGGDVTRSWKLPTENQASTYSAYFASVNWNKTSRFLDLADKNDKEELMRLIEKSDVLIVNFKNGDAEKFGLAYKDLKIVNEQLIYAEISGFGEDNDRVAYDLILQAETGFMSMNGTPNSGPVKMPIALIDLLAGHQLKEGILTALYNRDAKNQGGCRVSVSLYNAAVASLVNQATNWLMGNKIPQRIGSIHPNIAPYGEFFTTKDNITITFAIGSDKQFEKLCSVLNLNDLVHHPQFSTNQIRVLNRVSLASFLQDAVGSRISTELIAKLDLLFVPVGRIKNLQEVFEDQAAKELILEENVDGNVSKRPKTVVFHLSS